MTKFEAGEDKLALFLGQCIKGDFNMSPENWITKQGAKGLISKRGKGGGTFAHKDIAVNFCLWLSPKFQLIMVKKFQELIEEEFQKKSLKWHLTKITDNIDQVRNLLDTIPHQDQKRNRIKS